MDYNALDYEEINDHSDKEDRKQNNKIKMVQYPPPGSFKPGLSKKTEEINKENHEVTSKQPRELILNKKSEVLAMALGVQIKTGEDPPTGDISISGYEKKKKLHEKFHREDNNRDDLSRMNMALHKGPKSEVHLKKIPDSLDEQIKPAQNNAHREQHDFKRVNYERREEEQRRFRKMDVRRRSPDRNFHTNRYLFYLFIQDVPAKLLSFLLV